MTQKLLHEELGADYVAEWFNGALFQVDNKVHKLRDLQRSEGKYTVVTHSISLSAGSPRWAGDSLPVEVLKDFTTFKYPKLGYRQFRQGKLGNLVTHLSSTRAAQRGLRQNLIRWDTLPAFNILHNAVQGEGLDNINEARRVKEIFSPTFTPFTVGVNDVLKGDSLGFAVSEDLAVALSVMESAVPKMNVYFRGRIVGDVDMHGTLTLTNKILQRESVRRKLFR